MATGFVQVMAERPLKYFWEGTCMALKYSEQNQSVTIQYSIVTVLYFIYLYSTVTVTILEPVTGEWA